MSGTLMRVTLAAAVALLSFAILLALVVTEPDLFDEVWPIVLLFTLWAVLSVV